MIDVHAHLCYPDFDRDIDEVVERCRKELAAVIVSSARLDEGVKALELCRQNRGLLFPSIGYHPTEGGGVTGVIELIRENSREITAVGEAGLDFHREADLRKREAQREVFSEFIRLAQELGKPIVIHSWDAERQCYDMVRDAGVTCIFHCFSGDLELAREICRNPDFYISVSTQVLFSKGTRKVARGMPLESMLLETDSPFLSPVRGQRNFPWNILLSAEKIAELRHQDASEVLNAARENAVRAFGLQF